MILISDNVIAVFSVHYNVFIVAVNVFLRVLLSLKKNKIPAFIFKSLSLIHKHFIWD
jgi:hypothetical protein